MVNHQGFTLIELMIVVAIIAILAAIAISQYQDYVIRSQISEGLSLAGGAKTAMGEFYNDRGRWPNTPGLFANASVGLAQPTSINGSYVVFTAACGEDGCGGDTDPGAVGVAFSSTGQFKANRAIGGAGLTFVPTTHAGSISWRCQRLGSGTYLQDKWLPVTCR